jgi:two-component system, NtrC family, sensor kinase
MQELKSTHIEREADLRSQLEMTTRVLLKHQAMLARADRLAALGELSARMAHRLRNPLSGVLMTLTNLRDETASQDHRERLRQSIEALLRSFQELTELIEEARHEDELPVEMSLSKIVDELFMLVKHQAEGDALELHNEVSSDLVCKLPESGLRHALMILFMNSCGVQETREDGYIRVAAEDRGNGLSILVKDGGPGFSAAQLSMGSDGCHSWTRRGKGMGLAIVRRFVERLGGRMTLRNAPEGGAETILNIPKG